MGSIRRAAQVIPLAVGACLLAACKPSTIGSSALLLEGGTAEVLSEARMLLAFGSQNIFDLTLTPADLGRVFLLDSGLAYDST
jgi:hypothetical protein